MTTVPLERTDLEIIEALDFEHTPACGLEGHTKGATPHGGPAHVLVEIHCLSCNEGRRTDYICKPWWDFVTTTKLPGRCSHCGVPGTCRDFYTFIAWVNQ